MRKIKGYLDEWRVQEYLLITFFISWLSWGILILLTSLQIVPFMSVVGIILFGIGGFGPTIAALMCIDGKLSFKKVLHFIFDHRRKTILYFLTFAFLEIAAIALSSMQVNPQMPWWTLPLVFIMCSLVGGGNEELGWRGTLQPLIDQILTKRIKQPALRFVLMSVAIGIVWALWHLPLWFVSGSTQQGINYGLFAISTVLLSFWLACIYQKTRSIFYCMLFHGLSNVLMSFFVVEVNWFLAIGFAIMTLASIILANSTSQSAAAAEAKTAGKS